MHTPKTPVGIEPEIPVSRNAYTKPDTAKFPGSATIYLKGKYPAA
jgi:hypothetical protein